MFYKQLTDDVIHIGTPAKVNLFLQVLNRREDGYHDINSLFQAVSLFDRLQFEKVPETEITLTIENNGDLKTNDENLVVKAFAVLKEAFNIKSGLKVKLQKNIPVAAGLGGGSADAAACILAGNILFDLGMNSENMAELGASIGSDIPFFFTEGQALVTGRGEKVDATDYPLDYWLLLITPRLQVSTAERYRELKMGLTKSKPEFNLGRCQTVEEFIESLKLSENDFEKSLFGVHSVLGRIKDILSQSGALLTRMSGSGPTVFGIYRKAPEWEDNSIYQGDWQINLVRPITPASQERNGLGGRGGDY